MHTRKPILLRTDPAVLEALQRWAADELRSVNGQIDSLLRRALLQSDRLPKRTPPHTGNTASVPVNAESE